MAKFEYTTFEFIPEDSDLEDKLNELGEEGWELVSICPSEPGFFVAFLKREKL
ncbi:MAG: DUF4177 domain-containing protein [Bacteroidales bacterium]|nr:DUF4177 domain-containing protein [Bacteroidales bacterium]